MEQTQVTFSAFAREAEVSGWLAGMTFNDFFKMPFTSQGYENVQKDNQH